MRKLTDIVVKQKENSERKETVPNYYCGGVNYGTWTNATYLDNGDAFAEFIGTWQVTTSTSATSSWYGD